MCALMATSLNVSKPKCSNFLSLPCALYVMPIYLPRFVYGVEIRIFHAFVALCVVYLDEFVTFNMKYQASRPRMRYKNVYFTNFTWKNRVERGKIRIYKEEHGTENCNTYFGNRKNDSVYDDEKCVDAIRVVAHVNISFL
jgi:hypothetical protein